MFSNFDDSLLILIGGAESSHCVVAESNELCFLRISSKRLGLGDIDRRAASALYSKKKSMETKVRNKLKHCSCSFFFNIIYSLLTLLVSMFTWFRYFLWGVGLRLRLFFKLDDGGDKDNAFVVLGEDVVLDDDVVAAEAVDALNVLIDFRVDGGDLWKERLHVSGFH